MRSCPCPAPWRIVAAEKIAEPQPLDICPCPGTRKEGEQQCGNNYKQQVS